MLLGCQIWCLKTPHLIPRKEQEAGTNTVSASQVDFYYHSLVYAMDPSFILGFLLLFFSLS